MGQALSSSNSSLLSRKSSSKSSSSSKRSSVFGEISSSAVKFVRTSAFSEELIFTPRTSAHRAFKRYIKHQRRCSRTIDEEDHSGISRTSASEMMAIPTSTAGAALQLDQVDVSNISHSFQAIENQLVEVSVKVFLQLMETNPEMKQKLLPPPPNNSKTEHEIKTNEDCQKQILHLMGGIKRVVKSLNDPKSLQKCLKRLAKKCEQTGMDFSQIVPEEFAQIFCTAMKQSSPNLTWSAEVDTSWMNFFKNIVLCMKSSETRRASMHSKSSGATPSGTSGASGGAVGHSNGSDTASGQTKSGAKSGFTFDRHLVLVGCQTFQEFFDRHPEVLEHFDKFEDMEIDNVKVSEALKMHASRVLAIVEDIIDDTGNPDKIRSLMQDLGRHHFNQGISQEHLDMLGPIICQTIRPLVFKAGLWTIEVEKSWAHLFDMVGTLMKRGYPHEIVNKEFPTLTQTLILKDTWTVIVQQMHTLGLSAFTKLFRLNANFKQYFREEDPMSQEKLNRHFEKIVPILDDLIRSMPDLVRIESVLGRLGEIHCSEGIKPNLLDVMGPVFCNTVRPLLLVQGQWSYQVEMSWMYLFRYLTTAMKRGYDPLIRKDKNGELMASKEKSKSSKSL